MFVKSAIRIVPANSIINIIFDNLLLVFDYLSLLVVFYIFCENGSQRRFLDLVLSTRWVSCLVYTTFSLLNILSRLFYWYFNFFIKFTLKRLIRQRYSFCFWGIETAIITDLLFLTRIFNNVLAFMLNFQFLFILIFCKNV